MLEQTMLEQTMLEQTMLNYARTNYARTNYARTGSQMLFQYLKYIPVYTNIDIALHGIGIASIEAEITIM